MRQEILGAVVLAALLTGVQGCTQESPEPSAPHPFEAALVEGHLAKFRGLPPEFQDALREEAEDSSIAIAVRYLQDLPVGPPPVADLLPPEALDKFEELSPRSQRALLLAYDEAFEESSGRRPSRLTTPSAFLADMVDTVHEMEFGDGKVHLPPMDTALSREALAKLDSVDPRMGRAFDLFWHYWREASESVGALVGRLQEALLAAPETLPDTSDIGLSVHSLELLDEIPAAEQLVAEWLAAEIVRDVDWRSNTVALMDGFLAQFRTPEDRANLARLYLPDKAGVWHISCHIGPAFGVWPKWALPEILREVPPSRPMTRWPSHREALSPAALSKLDMLAPKLQGAFEEYWYNTGPLPMRAKLMACLTLIWDFKLQHTPFTEVPSLASVLSDEALARYESLPEGDRVLIESQLVRGILESELFGQSRAVYLHGMSTDEAAEAVRTWAGARVREAAARNLGP